MRLLPLVLVLVLCGCPGDPPPSSGAAATPAPAKQASVTAAFYVKDGCAECSELKQAFEALAPHYAKHVHLEFPNSDTAVSQFADGEHMHVLEWPKVKEAVIDLSSVRVKLLKRPGTDDKVQLKVGGKAYGAPGELENAGQAAKVWAQLRGDLVEFKNGYQGTGPGLPLFLDADVGVPVAHVMRAFEIMAWAKTNVQPAD